MHLTWHPSHRVAGRQSRTSILTWEYIYTAIGTLSYKTQEIMKAGLTSCIIHKKYARIVSTQQVALQHHHLTVCTPHG